MLSARSIAFTQPLLGFSGFSDFTLEPLDDSGLLFSLNASTESGPRMFVVDPQPFFPSYTPEVDPAILADLGTTEPVILVIVTAGDTSNDHTANLLAPLIINPGTGSAAQVVLDDDSWPLRAAFG